MNGSWMNMGWLQISVSDQYKIINCSILLIQIQDVRTKLQNKYGKEKWMDWEGEKHGGREPQKQRAEKQKTIYEFDVWTQWKQA